MQIIPLSAVPNQTLNVQLDGQFCTINVYQKLLAMYLDLYLNGSLVVGGVICENLNRIVRDTYFGFIGDLCFYDNQGKTDPYYTGLGSQYSLVYLEASDLPVGND